MGRYSKHPWSEKPVITLIQDAHEGRRPKGIKDKPLEARVRRLTDQEVKQLVAFYEAGDSTYALARRFDINRHTVSDHLRRNVIQIR